MEITKMKIFKWMCGMTRVDKIRNEYIRGSLDTRNIAGKMRE